MGKVSGSYESVVRGVSEQAAQNRRSGQHSAQVNMISDPVRGLARRHGSLLQDEQAVEVDAALYDKIIADTANHRVHNFFVGDNQYDLIVRTMPDTEGLGTAGFAFCFDKNNRQFIPIQFPASDPIINQLTAGGVSAFVNIGRYAYLAGSAVVPTLDRLDVWNNPVNKGRIAATVQLGAYNRTFRVTLIKPDGTRIDGTYTTPSSSL